MFNFSKNRLAKRSEMTDVSNQKVYSISQGHGARRIAAPLTPEHTPEQKIDHETANLINWLAQEQNTNPEVALKKAVATAAYVHDLTVNEEGKLLVLLKDGSIHEILLK
jgi:hypothetical protein